VKGKSITITCLGPFKPTWYKDSQLIQSPRVTTTGSDYTWTLTIRDIHLQDSGYYTCKGKTGQASTRLVVDVEPSVTVSVDPPTATVEDGKSALLYCAVSGKPRPTACWKVTNGEHDDTALHGRHQGNILVISANESGLYTCKAFNRAGQKHQSIPLHVLPYELSKTYYGTSSPLLPSAAPKGESSLATTTVL
jgi:uncharacterized protein YodC (DUF2158 family)